MNKKLPLMACAYMFAWAVASAQTVEINCQERSSIDPALYGRYMNICGGGQEFTKADFNLYQEQLGRLKLVRVWGNTYIDYAEKIADEALVIASGNSQLKQLLNGHMTETFAAE